MFKSVQKLILVSAMIKPSQKIMFSQRYDQINPENIFFVSAMIKSAQKKCSVRIMAKSAQKLSVSQRYDQESPDLFVYS